MNMYRDISYMYIHILVNCFWGYCMQDPSKEAIKDAPPADCADVPDAYTGEDVHNLNVEDC